MSSILRFKRGTAAQWTAANPVLLLGEPGFEKDTGKVKIGDGTSTWSALAYVGGGGGGGGFDYPRTLSAVSLRV